MEKIILAVETLLSYLTYQGGSSEKITILMLLVSALAVHAQSSVGGYIGFGRSAFSFEDFTIDPDAQAGYVPIGVQITLGDGMLQFGAEASYSAVPFKFEYENPVERLVIFLLPNCF